MNAEVKPGYKQTAVGVIPRDWDVCCMDDLGVLEMGKGLLKSDISLFGDIYAIPYTSLYTDFSEVIKPIHINWFSSGKTSPYIVNTQCVLFASSSNVSVNTGKACALTSGFPVAVGREVISFKTNQNVAFISYLLSTSFYRKKTLDLAKGITIKHVYPTTFVGYEIALPSLAEQSAIADSLGEVTAMIDGLDQMIAKKRNIQQATMQQLLTGQRRLPGFSGEWEIKRLGEIANIKTGRKNNQDKIEDGEYPFYVRSATVERINSYSHDCEAILVPGEGGIGSIFHYINGRFDVHQRVYAITNFSDGVSGKYVHLYMSTRFGAHAMQNSVKATVDSLRLPTFQIFEVLLPPTKNEQTAIASIFMDMDTELAALEARREKARQLKQGMMQELLTGRIRLV